MTISISDHRVTFRDKFDFPQKSLLTRCDFVSVITLQDTKVQCKTLAYLRQKRRACQPTKGNVASRRDARSGATRWRTRRRNF